MAKFAKLQISNASSQGWSAKEIATYGKPADLIVDTISAAGMGADQGEWESFHAAVGGTGARLLKEGV